MKKFLSMLMVLFVGSMSPQWALAEGEEGTVEVQYLVVTQTDGSKSEYALTDAPTLSFKADSIVVTCKGDEIRFDLAGLTGYHIETKHVSTSIDKAPTVENESETPSFAFRNATFSGLKAGTRIVVYTLDGQAVKTIVATDDGTAKVDLSDLARGVYILRAPNKSFKMVNK